MSYSNSKRSEKIIGIAFYIAIMGGAATWTDRSLEYLLTELKGEPVDVPLWIDFAINVVAGPAVITINILTELIRLV